MLTNAAQKQLIADLEQIITTQSSRMALIGPGIENPTVASAYHHLEGMVNALDAVRRRLQGDPCFLNIWK
jgi:hypothetical protein